MPFPYVFPFDFDTASGAWPFYQVLVDLNQDGVFVGASERIQGDTEVGPAIGIDIVRGRDPSRILAPPQAGSAAFELNNRAGTYSPGGDVVAGLPVRIDADWDDTIYNLFTGTLDKPQQHPDQRFVSVSIEAIGLMARLAGKNVSTALYSSITIDVAIGYLLDAVGWSATDRALDTAQMTLDWWWLDEQDAFEALMELLATEGPGASAIERGDGYFVFHDRHHILTDTRSIAEQATFRGLGASPVYSLPWGYDDGQRDVINTATMLVRTRAASGSAVVWTLGETLTLGADEVRKFQCRHVDGDPFNTALTPVEDTDYTVAAGSVTPSLDRTSGASVTLTMTAGAAGGTVTGLQLRAKLVPITYETQIGSTVDTTTSRTKYGVQTSGQTFRAEVAVAEAQNLLNAIVAWFSDRRKSVWFTVENIDTTCLEACLQLREDDRIGLIEATLPLDIECWIQEVSHTVRQGKHSTLFRCEEALDTGMFAVWDLGIWDESRWGF